MQADPPRDQEATAVHIQASLKEFPTTDDEDDPDRCQAYADSTGEQCKHSAIPGSPYCHDHHHLLDEVDIIRHGLKALKTAGRDERENPDSGGEATRR